MIVRALRAPFRHHHLARHGHRRWNSTLLTHYQKVVDNGYNADPEQISAMVKLGRLQTQLHQYDPLRTKYLAELEQYAKTLEDEAKRGDDEEKRPPVEPPCQPRVPRGMYLWGDVGTGKTFVMDLFFETTMLQKKKRVHFHEFMLEVHHRIHEWKQRRLQTVGRDYNVDRSPEGDAIAQVGKAIAQENLLLAFDEFTVSDVADALILKHLFGHIFANGTVVVATSNIAPNDLYKNGLNREYFAPFIGVLKSQCKVHQIKSGQDYRMLQAGKTAGWNVQNSDTLSQRGAHELFDRVCGRREDGNSTAPTELKLPVMFGRFVTVRHAHEGVGFFRFEDLCGDVPSKAMGAADFQALCKHLHTVIIADVPEMCLEIHNQVRRFITLVDQLYDHDIKLVISSRCDNPLTLFPNWDVLDDEFKGNERSSLLDIQLASKRTTSRLVEMMAGIGRSV